MAAERFVRAANSSAAASGCSPAAQARSRGSTRPTRPLRLPGPCLPLPARLRQPCPCLSPPVPARRGLPGPARPGRSPPLPGPARPFQRRPADGSAGPLLRARRGPRRCLPQRHSQILPGAHVYRNKYPRLVLNDLYRFEGREGGGRERTALLSAGSAAPAGPGALRGKAGGSGRPSRGRRRWARGSAAPGAVRAGLCGASPGSAGPGRSPSLAVGSEGGLGLYTGSAGAARHCWARPTTAPYTSVISLPSYFRRRCANILPCVSRREVGRCDGRSLWHGESRFHEWR